MNTVVKRIHPVEPEPNVMAAAADVLRSGGLVAFPTETVYGLGANALDPEAVRRIFEAKGRPANNPLIVHVAEAAEAERFAEWSVTAQRLAKRFWPGPLTLVLPRRAVVPDVVTAGGPTVAVRSPAHPVAQALIRAAGVPIAAPSANRSTQLSPTRAEHVLAGLDGRIEMVLDGGSTAGGLESTVIDLTSRPPRLLRPGLIGPAALEKVIGLVSRPLSVEGEDQALPSPGLLRRHYAPRAVLEVVSGSGEERVEVLHRDGHRVGWVTNKGVHSVPAGVEVIEMPADPDRYSARLYAVLHDLDARQVSHIVVAEPPDNEEWLAVRDRLRRASTR